MINSQRSKLKVIIVASGTGGHILPALSFAKVLQGLDERVEIFFIGTNRPLEETLIDSAGYKRYIYSATGVSKLGIRGFLNALSKIPSGFKKVSEIFSEINPDLVVGFGGYATVVPLSLAAFRKIPTIIFEAEKTLGLANKFLSLFVGNVATAYKKVPGIFRASPTYVGRILRPAMLNFKKIFPVIPRKILVMGGSQGCRSIDHAMLESVELLKYRRLEVWHQARPENVESLRAAYQEAGVLYKVDSFIDKPEVAYHWSDLVVSRAGAGIVLELSICRNPAILVPLPNALEQLENAEMLMNTGQALVVEEGEHFTVRFQESLAEISENEKYSKFLNAKTADIESEGAWKLAELALHLLCGK